MDPPSQSSVSEIAKNFYNEISMLSSNRYQRGKSKIINLRSFNNFIKAIILSDSINELKNEFDEVRILDLCCGKGGDINKWLKGGVTSVIFTDIADKAVIECEQRYRNPNFVCPPAEFIVADSSKCDLWSLVKRLPHRIHLTSCMFALHYSFESIERAYQILENACVNLIKGGKFVGIIPNAYSIYDTLLNNNNCFKNSILRLSTDNLSRNLFGSKYNFELNEVVSCPEFLVYFPLLESILASMNMKCNFKMPLHAFLKTHLSRQGMLERRMCPFKIFDNVHISDFDHEFGGLDYSHVVDNKCVRSSDKHFDVSIKTLSKEEWEVISLYTIFEFEKLGDEPNCTWKPLIPIEKEQSNGETKHSAASDNI